MREGRICRFNNWCKLFSKGLRRLNDILEEVFWGKCGVKEVLERFDV